MLALCCILLLYERSIGYLYIDIFLGENYTVKGAGCCFIIVVRAFSRCLKVNNKQRVPALFLCMVVFLYII